MGSASENFTNDPHPNPIADALLEAFGALDFQREMRILYDWLRRYAGVQDFLSWQSMNRIYTRPVVRQAGFNDSELWRVMMAATDDWTVSRVTNVLWRNNQSILGRVSDGFRSGRIVGNQEIAPGGGDTSDTPDPRSKDGLGWANARLQDGDREHRA